MRERAEPGRLRHRVTAAGAAMAMLFAATPAQSQSVAYNGSVQFATGDYLFTRRTDSFYFLNGLDLEAGRLRMRASVPLITQSTPWISYGPAPIPSGGNQSDEVARQIGDRGPMGGGGGGSRSTIELPTETLTYQTGIADPLVSGDVAVFRSGAGTFDMRLAAGVKVPVADPDDGFATGEWDYSGGVSLSHQASGRDSVFADLSYWAFGDMPDLAFRNALAYSFAYGRVLRPDRWSALASVYGTTQILDNSEAPVQLGFGLTRFFDNDRSLTLNLAVGLSETVPAFSAGVGWRLGL